MATKMDFQLLVTRTPEHATRRLVSEMICPRRRIRTRWSEAASRNGHLISISPIPQTCTYGDRTKNSALAGLVHARRRLQFGRNPPKDRGVFSEEKIQDDCGCMEKPLMTAMQHLSKARIVAEDTFSHTSRTEQPKTRPWRGLASYARRGSRRPKLNMPNSRSVLKPDSGYSLRST